MTIQDLRTYFESLQNAEGDFISDNNVKATAEYLLVHQFCPEIGVGNTEKARAFLIDSLPQFAFSEVGKGFKLMEKIWQIAVGIPEHTRFLSEQFLYLSLSGLPVSVKSSLLLVLFLQKVQDDSIKDVLEEVKEYQRMLQKTVSLNTLYETTHNLMTFKLAQQRYNVDRIILQSCTWLLKNVFTCSNCIDLLAETLGVIHLCGHDNDRIAVKKIFTILLAHQNNDGGFPVFAGGKSEFHPSLVSLWALTAYNRFF